MTAAHQSRPDPSQTAAQARILSEQGKHAEALALALSSYEYYPRNHILNCRLSDLYLKLGDKDAAMRHAKASLECAASAPDERARGHSTIAHVHLANGQRRAALIQLLQFKDDFPKSMFLDRQIKRLERTVGAKKGSTLAVDALVEQCKYGEAFDVLADEIKGEGYTIGMMERAIKLAFLGEREQAVEDMVADWRAAEPARANVACMMGLVLRRRRQHTTALPHLRAAMNLEPQNGQYKYEYLNTQLQLALLFPKAMAIVAPEMRRHLPPGTPQPPTLSYLAGTFYYVQGEYVVAQAFLQSVVDHQTPASMREKPRGVSMYLTTLKPNDERYRTLCERVGGNDFRRYLGYARAIAADHGLLFDDETARGPSIRVSGVYDRPDLAPSDKSAAVAVSAAPQRDDDYLMGRAATDTARALVINPRRR